MFAKGYRWKIVLPEGLTLYFKGLHEIGPHIRENYPTLKLYTGISLGPNE